MVHFARGYRMLDLDEVNNLGEKQKDNSLTPYATTVSALRLR